MLESPPTLKLAKSYEVPKRVELLERINQGQRANIVEGFTIQYNEKGQLPFAFYAEINVDNSRFWGLFLALSQTLPDMVSCLYGWHDEEPIFNEYAAKPEVLEQLQKFELELTQDCNLEFGLIYQTEEALIELFADNSKYFKFWGTDEAEFRQIISSFSITEVADLNFFDEFPKVVVPLTTINKNAIPTEDIIASLNAIWS